MWYCRTAKQRLWVGTGRYLSRCWGRHANANAYCYPDSYSYADTNTDSHAYTYPNGDANTYSYANGDAYSDSDAGWDHADGLRAQGAGQAHGGSRLERVECGQYRHLP